MDSEVRCDSTTHQNDILIVKQIRVALIDTKLLLVIIINITVICIITLNNFFGTS